VNFRKILIAVDGEPLAAHGAADRLLHVELNARWSAVIECTETASRMISRMRSCRSQSLRSAERKSVTYVSGTFCYYISGRLKLSGSSRCCLVRPRRGKDLPKVQHGL
jgi:hypothetical protein